MYYNVICCAGSTENIIKSEANMVRLCIKKILKEQNHTKYWLYKQLGLSYQNLTKIMNNETAGIRFETLEALCRVLNCSVGDLFEYSPKEK